MGAAPTRTLLNRLRKYGLRYVEPDSLTITRRKVGKKFVFFSSNSRRICDLKVIRRLESLAVPPAYVNVRYADDMAAHIQAIGRDAAGRLQYRYHPDWERLREARKTRRMARLVASLPRIRRNVSRLLRVREPSRDLALAVIVDLVSRTAIRAGSEEYLRHNGTRGAATLLKSDVSISRHAVTLKFTGKGGREIEKTIKAPQLANALRILMRVPGPRVFQYISDGETHLVTSQDVNEFLREIAETKISLKDFRTLTASSAALDVLVRTEPAASMRQRRKQVMEAISMAAEELANTPAICRRSYVHTAIVTAFENGTLVRLARRTARELLLSRVIAASALEQSRPLNEALVGSIQAVQKEVRGRAMRSEPSERRSLPLERTRRKSNKKRAGSKT